MRSDRALCHYPRMSLIGVGVYISILYSVVNYLYVSFKRLSTSVGKERDDYSAIDNS